MLYAKRPGSPALNAWLYELYGRRWARRDASLVTSDETACSGN